MRENYRLALVMTISVKAHSDRDPVTDRAGNLQLSPLITVSIDAHDNVPMGIKESVSGGLAITPPGYHSDDSQHSS